MPSPHLHPLDRLRLENDVKHAIKLGGAHPERIVAEAFLEIGTRIGGLPAIFAVLADFGRLTTALVRAAGGDKPLPRPLSLVPQADRDGGFA